MLGIALLDCTIEQFLELHPDFVQLLLDALDVLVAEEHFVFQLNEVSDVAVELLGSGSQTHG